MRRNRRISRRPTLGEWFWGGLCLILGVGMYVGALYGMSFLVENFWFGLTWELGLIILGLLAVGTIMVFLAYYALFSHPNSRVLREITQCHRLDRRDPEGNTSCPR